MALCALGIAPSPSFSCCSPWLWGENCMCWGFSVGVWGARSPLFSAPFCLLFWALPCSLFRLPSFSWTWLHLSRTGALQVPRDLGHCRALHLFPPGNLIPYVVRVLKNHCFKGFVWVGGFQWEARSSSVIVLSWLETESLICFLSSLPQKVFSH